VEALEDRLAPANVQWTGNAGNLSWTSGANWSTGVVPGSADDVTINIAVSGPITIASGSQSVNSLTDATAALTLSGGSLSLAAASSVSQDLTISGVASTLSVAANLSVGSLTLSGGTLTGAGTVTVSGQLTWTGGTMSGSGTTAADGPTRLGAPSGSAGSGSETLTARTLNLAAAATLNNSGPLSMQQSAALQVLAGGSLDLLAGSIASDNSATTVNNAGTLSVDSGVVNPFTIAPSLTNTGSVRVNLSTLGLTGAFTNFASNTLTGGNYVLNFGALKFQNASIRTNAANITLHGGGAAFVDQNGTNALGGFAANAAGASFTLLQTSVTTAAAFTNAGSLSMDGTGSGATFITNSDFTQSGSGAVTTLIGDGRLIAQGTAVTIGAGTTLQGTGEVSGGVVTNSGTISPGTASVPGVISILGVYKQTAGGTLDVKLGGSTGAGTNYDLLNVAIGVTLGGTIDVTEINGFVPQTGNQFQVLKFGPTANPGDFSTKIGFGSGISELFSPIPNPTSLSLVVGQGSLKFLTQPTDTTAGQTIDAPGGVQVELLDVNGNLLSGDNTDQVTLTTATGNLTGAGPVTVVNGIATFPNLSLTTAAAGYQLTASAANFASAVSNSFKITPGVPFRLEVTTQPTAGRVGDSLGTIVVTEEDQYHNVETNDSTGQMSVALSPNPGALAGPNSQNVVGGVATFTGLSVSQAGQGYKLTFSRSSFGVDSNAFDVAALNTTTAAADEAGTSGQNVTLQATVSAAGSSFPVNEGTVTFAVFAGNTQVGTAVTSATVSGGAASVSYALPVGTLAGTYSIHATYNPGADFGGSSDNTHHLAVAPGVSTPPVLPPLNGTDVVTLPFTQFPYSAALNATSTDGNPLTYSAVAKGDSPLYDLRQQYQFSGLGYITAGAAAYVLHSNQLGAGVGGYYLIRPSDGGLFAYDGSGSYAHSFANGTPLATLGANVFTDPTLLTNALPPADYTTLQSLQASYQFTGVGYFNAGAAAYLLHSILTAPGVGGYYLIRPSDGGLFAYDGSGSFSHTFADSSPLAVLGPGVYSFPGELLNARAAPSLYARLSQVNQQFDLQELGGSFYTNTYGHQAQWVYSPVLNPYGQHWYTLTLNGGQSVLRAWEGYRDSSVGAVVATFNTPDVYSNPALLTNATFLPDPAAGTATVDGSGNLTLHLPATGFVGTFKVVVTAIDGALSSSQTVTVNSTDTAPTLTVSNNGTTVPQGGTQTLAAGLFPLSDTVATTGASGVTVTTTASAASFSLPFSLQQRYQFTGAGYVTAGATAYVLRAVGNNGFGNPYYLLKSDGGLYAYDGSGSFASTFANVTPLANLGANFYADPTLLTSARPAVDYTTLYNLMQQYQFTGLGTVTAGATAYVLHSSQPGPGVGDYYLLGADGTLVPYDGSGSFALSFANGTPLATLDPGVFANPSLLLTAKAAPALYDQLLQAEQQFDLQELGGSFYTGLKGNAAKWLYSPIPNGHGQNWYTLVLSADGSQAQLYAWDGGNNSIPAGSQPVAVLDASVYADPTLLTNARTPVAATGVTAGIANGTLTVNAPASFVGMFQVTVTAADGGLTTTQTFQVASTDTAPVPNAVPPQTASQSGAPLQITPGATDAENNPVTYAATAVGYSAAYNLQQQYGFTGLGFFSAGGMTAYVLQSSVLGGSGGIYLLSNAGGVYAYDGSGSYAHTFANSANLVAQLDPSVYGTPTLLTQAQAPAAPTAVVSVSGNALTVNVAGVPVGTVFEVFVTASDGIESRRTGFLVTVTP
jgi:hypothetical protein